MAGFQGCLGGSKDEVGVKKIIGYCLVPTPLFVFLIFLISMKEWGAVIALFVIVAAFVCMGIGMTLIQK